MSLFRKRDLQEYDFQRRYAGKAVLEGVGDTDVDARFDIFLSHSHDDAELISELYRQIVEMGFTVYVDWIVDRTEKTLKVTPQNARWVRNRMKHCETLLYATSNNSVDSKWMPWELGYFDGHNGKVAILPIVEDSAASDSYNGQEFLGIYPYITKAVAVGSNKETLWARNSPNEYVIFDAWKRGTKPYVR